jgi:hypothetical protein
VPFKVTITGEVTTTRTLGYTPEAVLNYDVEAQIRSELEEELEVWRHLGGIAELKIEIEAGPPLWRDKEWTRLGPPTLPARADWPPPGVATVEEGGPAA